MKVRLLGTAAGGGFPQWNCACANCAGVRSGTRRARRRSQSSVAISSDGAGWFLLNASPDVRAQIESFAPLGPPSDRVRGSSLEGVLLSNADLDHTLGLFILREGARLPVYASGPIRRALEEGLRMTSVLEGFAGLEWREASEETQPLLTLDRAPSGLSVAFLPILGKPPRYLGSVPRMARGESVVMRLRDENTGGELIYAPGVSRVDEQLLGWCREASLLLLDGTFFTEDEMCRTGTGMLTASRMGHHVVGGPDGSLERIRTLPVPHKVYVHINNTNPMLDENSPEYARVRTAGVEVGWDGLEFTL
jgi:pyrroloquinoline quinone biosynthesis protein B